MSYSDKTLICSDCSGAFMFSAEAQGLSGELGYDQPARCPSCRAVTETARRRRNETPATPSFATLALLP